MSNLIGLITFHRTTNFGSVLQAYALYQKIVDLGYECELIDYRCPAIEARENLSRRKFSLHPKALLRQLLLQPALDHKAASLSDFMSNHTVMSGVYAPDTINQANSRYKKVIVGSDIVWGRDITEDDYTYFLDFIHEMGRKFAFSSSVGSYEIRGDEGRVGKLLSDFAEIAVREEDAVDWVRTVSGREAHWVCDPSMLLTLDEWKTAVPPKIKKGRYVLVYFDTNDHKCLNDAKKYARENDAKVLHINYGLPLQHVQITKPTDLQRFLGLIQGAEAVFTASYHGMLFSIYFHKQFFFYTRAHSSRVLSLARRLGLSGQCGDGVNEISHREIDYSKVDAEVENFRNLSIQILKKMLEA